MQMEISLCTSRNTGINLAEQCSLSRCSLLCRGAADEGEDKDVIIRAMFILNLGAVLTLRLILDLASSNMI